MTSVKPYFKELAYIQSDGNQYVDTGYVPNNTTKIEYDFEPLAWNDDGFMLGMWGNSSTHGRMCWYNQSGNPRTPQYGYGTGAGKENTNYKNFVIPNVLERHYVIMSKGKCNVDGIDVVTGLTSSLETNTAKFWIGKCNDLKGRFTDPTKIYSVKIYNDNVLIHDYIPVLDNNKKPALYDKITNDMCYNKGTGEFKYSFKDYKCELEYIESTGTQYIDTGVEYNESTGLDIKFAFVSQEITGAKHLAGSQVTGTNPSRYNPIYCTIVDNVYKIRTLLDIEGTQSITRDFDTNVHTLQFNKYPQKKVIYDGVDEGNVVSVGSGPSINFFRRNLPASYLYCSGKIYYCKMWDSTTLVRDFIPVLDWNDRPCLYDKVNNEFYYNLGTEEFKYACKDYQYKLEYIESTGTQYIDLEYIPKTNTITNLSCDYTFSGICYLFGATSNDYRTNCYAISGNNTRSTTYFRVFVAGNTSLTSTFGNIDNGFKTTGTASFIEVANTYTIIDDTTYNYTESVTGDLNISNSMFLFARDTNGTADNFATMKVYSLQIYEGNTLVRDMIPVMDWAGKPCLYDKITKRCYYNAGTGEFTYKYADYIAELGYLESDGNQYIDIGYVVGQRTDIEIEFMNLSNTPNIFGAKTSWSSRAYSLNSNDGYFCFNFGNNNSASTLTTTIPVDTTKWHIAKIETRSGGATGIVDDSSLPNLGNYYFTTEKNMILFGNNNADGTMNLAPSRISYCKIGWAGTTNSYFIPVLDPEGRPAMWNKLRNQLHYNQGTGEFRYGYKQQYTELEYIESDGTQYIDTGYIPTANTSFDLYGIDMDYTSGMVRFGSRVDTTNDNYCFTSIASNDFRFTYGTRTSGSGSNEQYIYSTHKFAKKVSFDASTKICTITFNDDTTESSTAFTSTPLTSAAQSIYLFAFNNNDSAVLGTSKQSGLKIYENDILVRDMIPVLDGNNIPCMYDKVEGKYYYNQGTEQFKYGQKGYYCEVEYLESTGTQYIDTGVNADSDLGIKYTYQISTLTNEALRFGAIWTDGSSVRRHHTSLVTSISGNGYYVGKSNYIAFCGNDLTQPHTYELNALTQKSYLDGVECPMYSQTTYEPFDCEMNYWLFGRNCNDTSVISYASLRIYNFKMYNKDVLVRDFIPVLDMNMKPCMYDKITGEKFYNLGTGEFNYGRKIYPVEYLQSNGTQYIDTGIYLNGDGYKYVFKYDKETIDQTTAFGYQGAGSTSGVNYQIALVGYLSEGSTYTGEDILWNGSYTPGTNRRKNNLVPFGLVEGYVGAKNNVLTYQFNDNEPQSYEIDSEITPVGNATVWLFANPREQTSGGHQEATMKFYYWKLYKDDELLADCIPAIDENGIGFMLDRITHTCHLNEGTGQFTYGPMTYDNNIPYLLLKKKAMMISYYKKGEYAPLKYLQSSGTQYIDLGIKADLNTRAEIAFCYPVASNVSGSGRVFGSREDSVTNAFGIGSYSGTVGQGTKITDYFSNGNTGSDTSTTIDIGKWYITYISKDLITNDGIIETLSSESLTEFTTPNTLKLFGFDNNGTMACGIVRIASCRIIQNNELIRDMIPVLDDFGVPCMWDRVHDTCYYNQGTGNFTYEEWDYVPVDYLRTNGNAWNNTFYYGNLNTTARLTAKNNNNATGKVGILLGDREAANSKNFSILAPANTHHVTIDFGDYNITRCEADLSARTNKIRAYNSKNYRYVIDESTGTQTSKTTSYSTEFRTPRPLYIAYKSVGFNASSMINYQGDIYSVNISEKTNYAIHMRRMIPVVDGNNRAGFYDSCLNMIFYSIGTEDWEAHIIDGNNDYRIIKGLTGAEGAYIDTGYKPNVNTSIDAKFNFKSTSPLAQVRLYGVTRAGNYSGPETKMSYDFYVSGAIDLRYSFGCNNTNYSGQWKAILPSKLPDENTHTWHMDKTSYTFDSDTSPTELGAVLAQSSVNMYLFYTNLIGNGVTNYFLGTVYRFKIGESGEPQRHMIPAHNGSELGMYDLVNKVWYPSVGSGSFTEET